MQAMLVQLTTVHNRDDVRILTKESYTLASRLPRKVLLMVADGKGHTKAELGHPSLHDLGLPRGGRLSRFVTGSWNAWMAIHRYQPDIVHFHDPELIPLGILLKGMGYKIIYDVHEDVPRQILSKHWLPGILRSPLAWVASGVEWIGAKAFNAVVPATDKIAGRFPADKTVTIQNYPSLTEMVQPAAIPYRERLPSFIYPGVIAPIRGMVEVVRALEWLADISALRLDLAGTFSPARFEEEMRRLPGWNRVSYHGWVSRKDLSFLMAQARAGLVLHHPVPNEIDAQPIKMFEYMSASLPVIASDFPAWRQVIESAGCGLLVDPLDPKAIAEAMRWILSHPDEAEAMGRRGRAAVEQTYNWDAEVPKLLALYGKLLSDQKTSNPSKNL